MNHELNQLLEKLATKLGTTAEYLWQVLILQARVSATITLVFVILQSISGIIIYRFHMRYSKIIPGDIHKYTYYDDSESKCILMTVAAILWAIMFIICLLSFPNVINGYFNPKYWALKEIIEAIK